MPERSRTQVGKIFARQREVTLSWSQKDTAKKADMGLATLQNAEYGKPEVTPKTYAKLAKAMGWPADAFERLLAGDDPATFEVQTEAEDVDLKDVIRDLTIAVERLYERLPPADNGPDAP